MNPHIRPWPSKRSIEQQLESLSELSQRHRGLCLYPTPEALRRVRMPRRFTGQPYRQAMAKGHGTLELAYFRFDVLESYRNDPRFYFKFHDYGAQAFITADVYMDDDEQEADKISIDYIGFAYDLSAYKRDDPQSPLIRRGITKIHHSPLGTTSHLDVRLPKGEFLREVPVNFFLA